MGPVNLGLKMDRERNEVRRGQVNWGKKIEKTPWDEVLVRGELKYT